MSIVFGVAHVKYVLCVCLCEWIWNVFGKFLLSFQVIWIFKLCPKLCQCMCVCAWNLPPTPVDAPQIRADFVWVEMTASLNISCLHNLINRIKSILWHDAFHNKTGRHYTTHPHATSAPAPLLFPYAPIKFNVFKCTCEWRVCKYGIT